MSFHYFSTSNKIDCSCTRSLTEEDEREVILLLSYVILLTLFFNFSPKKALNIEYAASKPVGVFKM